MQRESYQKAKSEAKDDEDFARRLLSTLTDEEKIDYYRKEEQQEDILDHTKPCIPTSVGEHTVESPAPVWLKDGFDFLMHKVCKETGFKYYGGPNDFDETKVEARSIKAFQRLAHARLHDRRICITQDGYIGLVPSASRPGDLICVLHGGSTLFVLRPGSSIGDSERFQMIGEAYMHGMMDGGAISAAKMLGHKEESFTLT